jgi:3-isopropylmalate/(R)-2-methylmalate dehydratase small subunit
MPRPLVRHRGISAALPMDNIDTDQIIPSREMKSVSRDGLADGLFAGWRYIDPGSRLQRPDFVLNRVEGVSVIVSGHNFGCGSSREHAVWALAEFGIRAVLAKSFGDIFQANCFRNGVLAAVLPEADIDFLAAQVTGREVDVDVETQRVTIPTSSGWSAGFDLPAFPKRLLIEGLDPIGLTLKQADEIAAFRTDDEALRPWVYRV